LRFIELKMVIVDLRCGEIGRNVCGVPTKVLAVLLAHENP
jgi:hypothetical protein